MNDGQSAVDIVELVQSLELDYMRTDLFKQGMMHLSRLAQNQRTFVIRGNLKFEQNSRNLIAYYLFLMKGVRVIHIRQGNEKIEHVLTLSARVGLEDINHDETLAESRLHH